MQKKLEKTYDPHEIEDKIYAFWTDGGYFHAEADKSKKPFTIVMPPPNITGQLHMGHALDCTLQDIIIRYKRMQGYNALWLPGTDHASIATEAKIVAALKEEGLSKDSIGRDEFLRRAWKWKEKYGGKIVSQQKKLGSSCDWDRLRFTMDEGCSAAVREVFVNLYEKGLIYRGERMINWCPNCRTSISNIEVEYEEQQSSFWHIRYPFKDGSGYIELATTRPETLLGDVAVAVNPEDDRYADAVGKTLILPLVGREIPVIADDYVEKDFGTGAVKITPAHDPNDFEVGLRHSLPVICVMTEDAHITDDYPAYAGMDRFEARKKIVDDLEKQGYLIKTEPYAHNVGTCQRCHTTVEPRVSMQWFVKMKPLAEPAIDAVKNGQTNFIPERFQKIYFHWLENIQDWCISRQLWWGHRVPAWYCPECGHITVSRTDPDCCEKCGCGDIVQDEDTLDTWFSSALWPFSTLGWPEHTADLDCFYPTDTLVTGYDIIPFWVMRMMFSGIEQTGQVPFKTVLIHGLVRDSLGRKMSKTLGNGVDPLEVIDTYGADALRYALITGNSPGNDMRYLPEKTESGRNFANKLWNAARFAQNYLTTDRAQLPDKLFTEDKWILKQLNDTVKEVCENLDKYELGIAAQKIYDFIWDKLCDWYIELVKPRLFETNTDAESNRSAQSVLLYVLLKTLALLHPFMPFITEEIWQTLPHDGKALIVAEYPSYDPELDFASDSEQMEQIMALVRAVRQKRTSMNVPASRKAALFIKTEHPQTYLDGEAFIMRLASASQVSATDEDIPTEGNAVVITPYAKAYIPLGELIDKDAESQRLQKEIARYKQEIERIDKKLSNVNFVAKAPEKVVQDERDKRDRYDKLLQESEEVLKQLSSL